MLCQHCQPLILDALYGLLDEPEAAAVQAHLRECPACSAAQAEAARVQGLLARAARNEYPQVRFEPPVAAIRPPAHTATAANEQKQAADASVPASLALPVRGTRVSVWLAWAIAATVIFAIPGTVVPVLDVIHRADQARTEADSILSRAVDAAERSEKAVADVQTGQNRASYNLAVARQARDGLLARWVADEQEITEKLADRKMTVSIHKPATAQPGAPNEFLLVYHDKGLSPNKRLLAEVRDQTDAVIFSQRLDPEHDSQQLLRLPAEAWARLKPQSELFLAVAAVDEKTGAKTDLQEKVRLFGPVYATMLVTDRPVYRPGETLYFRSLTLDRVSFRPPPREQFLLYELHGPGGRRGFLRTVAGGSDLVRVSDGKVEQVVGPDGSPVRGVGCGAFPLPADLPDGEYTLTLREPSSPAGYPPTVPMPVSRRIKVRSGAVDVYAKTIDFGKASFSPGDTVDAIAELKFKARPVEGVGVRAMATVDGVPLPEVAATPTDPKGKSYVRFTLPPKIDRGDVRLKVTFAPVDGEEWVAERVPVAGRKVIVEFFPEGGYLVAGIPSRVYVRATSPDGRPVDIRGTITDGRGALAAVETITDRDRPGVNRGLGVFTITPTRDPTWLKLASPADAFTPMLAGRFPVAPAEVAGAPAVPSTQTGFPLPTPESDGVVMTVENPVTEPGEPFHIRLQTTGRNRNLVVGAYTRGRLSDTRRLAIQSGMPAKVDLMASPDLRGGVVRITVFEEQAEPTAAAENRPDLKPVAERLVFRTPGEALKLAYSAKGAKTADGSFQTNSPLDLGVTATDESGRPTAAVLWAAAVNTGVEPGKTDRLLTTHFLLAGEVSSPDAMEYADFLLTDQPRAAECLDLVLATQGWRRFVEQTPVKPVPQAMAALRSTPTAERTGLATATGQYPVPADSPAMREHRKLYEKYWPMYETAARALTAAEAALKTSDSDASARATDLVGIADQARTEAQTAADQARDASVPVDRVRTAGWYGVAGFGIMAVMLGGLAVARPFARLPYGIGTAGALGLAAFLVTALGVAERTEAAIRTSEERVSRDIHIARLKTTSEREELSEREVPKTDDSLERLQMKPAAPMAKKSDAAAVPLPGAAMPPPQALDSATRIAGAALEPVKGALANAGQTSPPAGQLPPQGGNTPPGAPGKGPGGLAAGGFGGGMGGRGGSEREGMSRVESLRLLIPDSQLSPPRSGAADERALYRRANETATEDDLWRATELAREHQRKKQADLGRALEELQNEKSLKRAAPAAQAMDVRSDQPIYDRLKSLLHPPLVVREYAAPRPGSGGDGGPSDTILWQPVIVVPGDGKTTLHFQLGSARGGYQLVIAGHTLDGRIGAIRVILPVTPGPSSTLPVVPNPPTVP